MNLFATKSWKTTSAGLLMIIGAAFALKKLWAPAWAAGDFEPVAVPIGTIIGGFGLIFARDNDKSSESVGASAASGNPIATIQNRGPVETSSGIKLLIGAIGIAIGMSACATLDPNADVLVVRAEQAEQAASATLDLMLNVENDNRAYFKANVPEFHQFAEWWRQPQAVNGTNYPRAIAVVVNLENVKRAYKSSRSLSNNLVTATISIETAIGQASQWLSKTTNSIPR